VSELQGKQALCEGAPGNIVAGSPFRGLVSWLEEQH
jgi:hypothetical protein